MDRQDAVPAQRRHSEGTPLLCLFVWAPEATRLRGGPGTSHVHGVCMGQMRESHGSVGVRGASDAVRGGRDDRRASQGGGRDGPGMTFQAAQKDAAAVLYESYVLYPDRASEAKNRVRWQFCVVMPGTYARRGGPEPCAMQTECLIDPRDAPEVDVRLRFLQLQVRTPEIAADLGADTVAPAGDEAGTVPPAARGGFSPVDALEVNGHAIAPWDEGAERIFDLHAVRLTELLNERAVPVDIPGGRDVELVRDDTGRVVGRIVRDRWPISAIVRLSVEALGSALKLRVRIENRSECPSSEPDDRVERRLALRHALLGAHTLLAVRDGEFVSLLDPPEWAEAAVVACDNVGTWPVLVGGDRRDVMLSSPIILYDYPEVAPESPGDLCDATEIDEILTLRVMTLTDDEKREARGTD